MQKLLHLKEWQIGYLQKFGGKAKVNLSKTGKSMLLNNILETNKTECLGKSNENVDLILRTITELKKHNVEPKDIEDQIMLIRL